MFEHDTIREPKPNETPEAKVAGYRSPQHDGQKQRDELQQEILEHVAAEEGSQEDRSARCSISLRVPVSSRILRANSSTESSAGLPMLVGSGMSDCSRR